MAEHGTDGTPKKVRPPKGWRKVFLAALTDTGNVRASCHKAGVGRTTVYRARDADPKFAARWDEACEDATDVLETEARRRAVEGTVRRVYQGGKKVGTVREFSDTLLIFLMKANRPSKYRDGYDAAKQLTDLLTRAQRFSIPADDPRPEPEPAG